MSQDPPSLWFVFRGSELLVRLEDSGARVPNVQEWSSLGLAAEEPHAVGALGELACWAVGLAPETNAPEGMAFHGLRRLWGQLDEDVWKTAGRAVQIVEWDRNHRFCGRCGAETARQTAELARTCPRCGLQQFPRISPAVIVRVERGDRILLARSPHFAPGVYSTLAGFVEPGESLEETVVREVREEVGVTVTDLRYFGSQPWPFPHSLMLGFLSDWESGDIVCDESEIAEAEWFKRDALPNVPPRMSIARRLIDAVVGA